MKVNMFKIMVCVATLVTVAACGAGKIEAKADAETTATAMDRVIAAGVLPVLDTQNGSGVDADNNGVRDDVDSYIQKTWGADVAQAKAATQMAAAIQSAVISGLSINSMTPDQLDAVGKAMLDAVMCLGGRFKNGGEGGVLTQLESITTNTKERYLAYSAYNDARSGTSALLPSTDPLLNCK